MLTSFFGIDNYSAKEGSWLPGQYYFYDNPAFEDSSETRQTLSQESKNRSRLSWLKYKVKKLMFLRYIMGPFLILGQILAIVRYGVRVIQTTNAEIVMGISDFGPALIASYFIYKKTKKPLVLYFFDLYWGNNLMAPGNFLAKIFEPKLFRCAEKIIVTNEGTKNFYIKRYGEEISKKIIVIYNSIFPEGYTAEKITSVYSPQSPYTILFTGSIYWPQIGALKNLIRAVNQTSELDLRLKIYSPTPKNYLDEVGIKESNRVELAVAPPQDMPKIQGAADILFLPLSWNTESPQIIDTATPGKLTDYLIAGKPMLIHAPASSHVIQYAKKNNVACCVDEDSIEKLKEGIKKLLTNHLYAEELVKNAKATFFRNHDANKNFSLFKALFLK